MYSSKVCASRNPFLQPRYETVKSLLTICIEYILKHMHIYSGSFPILPMHIKSRILKRLTSVKVNCPNIKQIYGMLLHSQLKQVDFSLTNLDDDLLNLVAGCHNIHELILTRNENNTVSEAVLMNVMGNFKNLLVLQIPNCDAVTDAVVNVVVENSPYLSGVDISGCTNITDESVIYLATKLQKLTALNVSRTKVTDAGIVVLAEGPNGPFLKELRIADCTGISHSSINFICEKCAALEVFIFNNCAQTLDQTTVNFESKNLKHLKQLTWSVYW